MEKRWLLISDICKYLGISNNIVYKRIDKQSMPAHRMGHLWKVKKGEVDSGVKSGAAKQPHLNKES